MVIQKRLKILLIILSSLLLGASKCQTPGNVKLYAVHPEMGLYRHDENGQHEWIDWTDPRLQCREIIEGDETEYECPYGAMTFDDIGTIIDLAQ